MGLFKKSKKGSVGDIAMLAVILFVFSITVLIGYVVYSNIDSKLQDKTEIPNRGKVASTAIKGKFTGVIDNSYIFLMLGLAVAAFALAATVRVHPVFIVFFFIILGVIIVLSGIFSNIYTDMAANSDFAIYSGDFTFIRLINTYLPMIVGVLGTLMSIVMYKAWSDSQ